MFNPFIIVLVVLLIIVIGLAAYLMTRPKGIAVETQQETRSLSSNTSSDVSQTKGSDIAQTKGSDIAQTKGSDIAQTKGSDVAQTKGSDVAVIPTQVVSGLAYNLVGSILINNDSRKLNTERDVKIFDENGNVISWLNTSFPNAKGITGVSPAFVGPDNTYLKIDFNQAINLSKIVITKPPGSDEYINEVITFPSTRATFSNFIPIKVKIKSSQDKYTIIYTTDKPPVLSTESFSFANLPQYLRHLQNKNYLL